MSRRSLVFLSLVLVLLLVSAGATFAQSGTTKQVALVVTFADGATQTEVVTVPAAATTLDALKASKVAVVTQMGSFGESVCKLNDTGCPADNCFCQPDKFWAYFHLSGSEWAAAAEGAGVFVPQDKAVEGFAWSGFDANFNPTTKPPLYTFDQLSATAVGPSPVLIAVVLVVVLVAIGALVVFLRRRRTA